MRRDQKLQADHKIVKMSDLKAMAIYGKTPVLKKITLMFIAARLDQVGIEDIQRKFRGADKDENGLISQEEFNLIFREACN